MLRSRPRRRAHGHDSRTARARSRHPRLAPGPRARDARRAGLHRVRSRSPRPTPGGLALERVHQALAEVSDSEPDADLRAWHRAPAAPAPDEDVATELERSASRARARGGVAATAAFLKCAADLTPDPARQRERMLS